MNVLGYQAIMWSDGKDSGDSHFGGTHHPKNGAIVLKTIKTWLKPQPGFISLQHDINEFGIEVAIMAIKSLNVNLALKPQPVSVCLGDLNGYQIDTVANPQTDDKSSTQDDKSSQTDDHKEKDKKENFSFSSRISGKHIFGLFIVLGVNLIQ